MPPPHHHQQKMMGLRLVGPCQVNFFFTLSFFTFSSLFFLKKYLLVHVPQYHLNIKNLYRSISSTLKKGNMPHAWPQMVITSKVHDVQGIYHWHGISLISDMPLSSSYNLDNNSQTTHTKYYTQYILSTYYDLLKPR